MSGRRQEEAFGGAWTAEKLAILEAYLNAYTTALIKQQFSLIYIDAFAGSGQIQFASANHEGRGSKDFLKYTKGIFPDCLEGASLNSRGH